MHTRSEEIQKARIAKIYDVQLCRMAQAETKITNDARRFLLRVICILVSHRSDAALEDTNKVFVNHFVESTTRLQTIWYELFADLLHVSADTFGISSMIRKAAKSKSCPTILESRAIVTQDPRGNRNISPVSFSIDPWGSAKRAMNHSDDSHLENMFTVLALKSTIYWWNNRTSCNVILLLWTQLTLH